MKKFPALFLAAIIAMTEVGCDDSEYTYTSYYEYRNDSSSDIHFNSYSYASGELLEEPDYSFVIPVGDSHTLRFDTEGGYPYPFMWASPCDADQVIVSDNNKQIIYIRHPELGNNKLFREDSYEIIKSSKKRRNRTCLYIFTDKDFEDARPL